MAQIWMWIVIHWQEFVILGVIVAGIYKILRPIERFLFSLNNKLDHLTTCDKERAEDITVMVKGLTACLDGLHQQGANGPVSTAREDLQNHLYKRLAQIESR
jgi:hypothetical protein